MCVNQLLKLEFKSLRLMQKKIGLLESSQFAYFGKLYEGRGEKTFGEKSGFFVPKV